MKRTEIEKLAKLARIELAEEEIVSYEQNLSSIVDYVSKVNEINADKEKSEPLLGKRFNVFRKDEITNEPNQYSEDIIAEMPTSEGRFLSVPKILQVND